MVLTPFNKNGLAFASPYSLERSKYASKNRKNQKENKLDITDF